MVELLDIVNEFDEVVGVAPFDDVYEKKFTHRIVHVHIFNSSGEMGLQKRSKQKKFCPGHWSTTVGGHVQSGETYEQAAYREYFEELGNKSRLIFVGKDLYEVNGMKKFLVSFRTQYDGPFSINSEEVESVEYFPLKSIEQMIKKGEKFHPELLFLLKKRFEIS